MAGWNGWAPLGAQLAGGGPVVVRNADGRLELFGTTGGALGPELSHAAQTSPNNGWSAWTSLGAPAAQFLGAIDGGRQRGRAARSVWSGWADEQRRAVAHLANQRRAMAGAPGTTLAAGSARSLCWPPAMPTGAWRCSRLGTGPGELEHIWQLSPGAGWSSWAGLGTLPGGFPVQLAVARNADGRLELFNMGSGGLWHNWQTSPGGGWAGWSSLGTPPGVILSGVAVGTNADGRLEVFTTGQNALWHIWQSAPNSGWSAWDSLGNPGVAALAAPAVASECRWPHGSVRRRDRRRAVPHLADGA